VDITTAAGDLYPNHIIAGTDGQRWVVVGNERIRRGVVRLTLSDLDTGFVVQREMGAGFLVTVTGARSYFREMPA